MTNKEFVKINFGRKIKYKYDSRIATIVGYNIENTTNFAYTYNDDKGANRDFFAKKYAFLLPGKTFYADNINQIGHDKLYQFIEDNSNDCLDCGARGNEECKITCPNK